MENLTDIRAAFFGECEEGLLALEEGLTTLGSGGAAPGMEGEVVHAIFRAVHSIKGGAGAFGFVDLVTFAHGFETVLDELRGGRLGADGDLVAALLSAADVLADLVAAARDGSRPDAERVSAASASLAARLPGAPLSAAASPEAAEDEFGFRAVPVAMTALPFSASLTVRFRPHAALYARGNETGLILRELARLGPLGVTLDASEVAPLDRLDLAEPRLRWTLRVAGVGEEAVRTAFEWVEGDCDLSIGRDEALARDDDTEIAGLLARLAAETVPAGTPPAEAAAPARATTAPRPSAEPFAPDSHGRGAEAGQTIRVDLDRVDRLVDLVGELVIHGAVLMQRATETGTARSGGLEDLERLTRDLQDSVMAIRAQPVRAVFQRMPRLVREVASRTGKRVRLVMEGESTEVDRTVIERLGEPLTHMIRNAVDHGIEAPEDRLRAGKPPEGTLRLSASHRSGRILIEVTDDGAGIHRARVRGRAVECGLIAPDATLSDEEVDNLIFLPGFSTVETVSDISGRGVGMDVVRRSVTALGGRITIASRPGGGSTFTLSLPLTLAVLDGMVIEAAGQTLVLPISAILETLRPKPGDLRTLGGGTPLLVNRGSFVPIVDVGRALGFRDASLNPAEGIVLLVESDGGRRAALLADHIHGGRQVVIKSLEANYRAVPGISAATILGDGRVALILDADTLAAACGPVPLAKPLSHDEPRRLVPSEA